MSDRIDDDKTLFGDDESKRAWQGLAHLSHLDPSATLRQRVLNDLHSHTVRKRPWWASILPAEPPQWLGLTAAVLAGLIIGHLIPAGDIDLDWRMAQMERQLDAVNEQLLMSRLNATAPGDRLAAVLQAAMLERRDPAIAAALVQRASIDTVPSVRSAAIEALGNEINQEQIATQLLAVLSENDSPIVQMAIVDLILRRGNEALLESLRQHVRAGALHPALAGYLQDTMGALET